MKVTPIDLRQAKFKTVMRGYDRGEVQAFLLEVADDYENALRETDTDAIAQPEISEISEEGPLKFDAIVEFLKLHYAVSRRADTAYWRDNTDPASWPEGLRDKVAQWRRRLPSRFDFVVDHETFLPPSWAFILHGLGFGTQAGAGAFAASPQDGADARTAFDRVRQAGAQAVDALPDHRALLDHYQRQN